MLSLHLSPHTAFLTATPHRLALGFDKALPGAVCLPDTPMGEMMVSRYMHHPTAHSLSLSCDQSKAEEEKVEKCGEDDETVPAEYRLKPALVSLARVHAPLWLWPWSHGATVPALTPTPETLGSPLPLTDTLGGIVPRLTC